MHATLTGPAADDVQVYDLDLLAGSVAGAHPEPRVAPYPLEPTAWIEWSCPVCHELYGHQLGTCPADGQPLRAVLVSRPFLWLG